MMQLSAVEFIRRFLLHVLPKGFVHIRHYGFLANSVRGKKLPHCRELLETSGAQISSLDDIVPAFTWDRAPGRHARFPLPQVRKGSHRAPRPRPATGR